MDVFAEAASIILAIVAVGQEFVCIDNLDFSGAEYSAEYLTGSLFAVGVGGSVALGKGLKPRRKVRFAEEETVVEIEGMGFSAEERAELKRSSVWKQKRWNPEDLEVANETLAGHGSPRRTKEDVARANKSRTHQRGPDIILMALGVVQTLNLTTGLGPPDEGENLKDGSAQFASVSGQLGSAFPSAPSWSGDASRAYASQNTVHQGRYQRMADLDRQLVDYVKSHAAWVNRMRLGFEILTGLALVAYMHEGRIRAVNPGLFGLEFAFNFACIVSAIGILVALGMVGTLAGLSWRAGQAADGLTSQYKELASAAAPFGMDSKSALDQTRIVAAAPSTFSGFVAPNGGLKQGNQTAGQAQPVASMSRRERGGAKADPVEQAVLVGDVDAAMLRTAGGYGAKSASTASSPRSTTGSDIGVRKVVASEQQWLAADFGQCIREAVAVIQPGAVSPFSIGAVGDAGDVCLVGVDRNQVHGGTV